ncbi:putative Phosphatidylinositol-binding clathrin assembly protein LAP [Danaus plexippus plexippus]|uniref:Phosphatidylinositol-binding clathrin assembly protein LAP n=1 Tax=Danaus plexippus plexippus TaxID=278856 RepID=A0A212EK41_DANPL|nr:putative Phosphatidylinositol-binding clathrin assembly protein LAP [Danaus plexippus plexippus]
MSGLNVRMAGQTINDRLLAARHSIAGQGLAKSQYGIAYSNMHKTFTVQTLPSELLLLGNLMNIT